MHRIRTTVPTGGLHRRVTVAGEAASGRGKNPANGLTLHCSTCLSPQTYYCPSRCPMVRPPPSHTSETEPSADNIIISKAKKVVNKKGRESWRRHIRRYGKHCHSPMNRLLRPMMLDYQSSACTSLTVQRLTGYANSLC